MSKGVSIICHLFLAVILCSPVHVSAQEKVVVADTSEYLPLFVSGALEYNLLIAASKGYYTEVERMILMGAEVETETSEYVTPLIYAVICNEPETVKLLLKYDADPNRITNARETPLLITVKNDNFEIAETLIRYGAKVDYQGNYGAAALHFAAVYGLLQIADLLLYYDAEVDLRTNDGTTPLMAAIWSGFADVAELLIQYGANMEARDNEGFTPYLIAAQNGDTVIMSILQRKGADIYEKNLYNWDALDLAIRTDQKKAAEMLIKSGGKWADPGREVISPYNIAVTYRDMEMIDLLEKYKFPINKKSGFDQMALSLSNKTDFRDYYSGFSLAFKEPLRNLGIITGFDTKLWYTRVLVQEDEKHFYQYLDKSSLVYAGIFKEFQLTDNLFKSNYSISASLSAGYSFGNKLKGTLIASENKIKVIPAVSFKWLKNNLALISGIEFTNTDFFKIGPIWGRIGISYNFFFNNVRAPVKTIKWY